MFFGSAFFLFTPLLLLLWAPPNHLMIFVRCSTTLPQRKDCVSCNEGCATVPKMLFFVPWRNDPKASKRGECLLIRQKRIISLVFGYIRAARGTRREDYDILIWLLTEEEERAQDWGSLKQRVQNTQQSQHRRIHSGEEETGMASKSDPTNVE